MLYARETKPTHENFEARCPACLEWIIFNRATDFEGATKISYREVTCPQCQAHFAINGDNADSTYAILLFEVFELLKIREYARAITTITQSYEAFFLHTLREQLVLKLLIKDRMTNELQSVNEVLCAIHKATKGWPYRRMRNAFIHLALNGPPRTITDARDFVQRLPTLNDDPGDALITAHEDQELAALLIRLKHSTIHEVRNDVAHKFATRPTRAQAEALFDEARDLIWGLADNMDVRFDSC